jgi:hypothetical protein
MLRTNKKGNSGRAWLMFHITVNIGVKAMIHITVNIGVILTDPSVFLF